MIRVFCSDNEDKAKLNDTVSQQTMNTQTAKNTTDNNNTKHFKPIQKRFINIIIYSFFIIQIIGLQPQKLLILLKK